MSWQKCHLMKWNFILSSTSQRKSFEFPSHRLTDADMSFPSAKDSEKALKWLQGFLFPSYCWVEVKRHAINGKLPQHCLINMILSPQRWICFHLLIFFWNFIPQDPRLMDLGCNPTWNPTCSIKNLSFLHPRPQPQVIRHAALKTCLTSQPWC